jgi:ribonuclease T2
MKGRVLWMLVCVLNGLCMGTARGADRSGTDCRTPDLHDSYVLAITWQPGFCEHVAGGDRKPECEWMARGRLRVDHLTLHGLWPNRRACGGGYGQCGGRPLNLHRETVAYIKPWMPNFYVETDFGAYEWQKHGTCQTAMDDDTYFRRAVDAVATVDRSPAGQYLRAHIGGTISKRAFLAAVNEAAGNTRASNSVVLLCRGRYLYEIRVTLPREFKEGATLAELLGTDLPARPTTDRNECRQDQIRIEQSGVQ